MAIPFLCDHCGRSGKTTDSLAGKRVKCDRCGGAIQIPVVEIRSTRDGGEVGGIPTAQAVSQPRRRPVIFSRTDFTCFGIGSVGALFLLGSAPFYIAIGIALWPLDRAIVRYYQKEPPTRRTVWSSRTCRFLLILLFATLHVLNQKVAKMTTTGD